MAEPNLLAITDVTPHTQHPWRSRVMIVEKGFPRDPKASPTKFQRLILTDSQGNRAQATIFGRDIELLKNTLLLFKHYYISNAHIRPIEQRHRIVPNQYQWIINCRTIIEEAPHDELFMLPMVHNFVPFSQMEQYKDSPTLIDIIGVAVQVNPIRFQQTRNGSVRIREVLLVDNDLNSIVLTMWNQFLDNEAAIIADKVATRPVLIGLRVKAVAFNGVSISSRVSSSFLVDPNINAAADLRARVSANSAVVDAIIAQYNNDLKMNPPEMKIKKEDVDVASLDGLPDNVTYMVTGSITIRTDHNPLWYMGCSGCYHAINATYLQPFTCYYECPAEKPHAIPRCRVNVILSDKSGEVLGTFFGPAAERVIGFTAKELMTFAKDNGPRADLMSIVNLDPRLDQIVQVKPSMYKDLKGEMKKRYTFSFPPDGPTDSNDMGASSSQIQIVEKDTPKADASTAAKDDIHIPSDGASSINSELKKIPEESDDEEIVWAGKSLLVEPFEDVVDGVSSSNRSKKDRIIQETPSNIDEATSETLGGNLEDTDTSKKGKRVRMEESPHKEL